MNLPVNSSLAVRDEPAGSEPKLRQFSVALPPALQKFGKAVGATVYGESEKPVILLVGGISADRFPSVNSDGTDGWWSGIAGVGRAIDPFAFQIVGVDFAADEGGQFAPSTGDQAAAFACVLEALGMPRIHAIVGASYGGMAALSFAELYPDRIDRLVIISAPAEPHTASTACREIQRQIVALGLRHGVGEEALGLARGLAMMSYRTPEEFEQRFKGGIDGEDTLGRSEAGAYLYARGKSYPSIISPGRFISLSASIDRHRVDPGAIRVPALLVGSTTDRLVPRQQMEALARRYGGPARLDFIPSRHGHDMFLKDVGELGAKLSPFLARTGQ